MYRRHFLAAMASSVWALQEVPIDTPFVPTPPEVVDAMLDLAQVQSKDTLYDLGSGDGRIVIAAARRFQTRGVGIEQNLSLVRTAAGAARKAGVDHLVRFIQDDLFQTNLAEATVVTLYLLPEVNLALRPKLWRELRPGTRIVSHAFGMGDWRPRRTVEIQGAKLFLWVAGAGA